jgi:hypothetical protein
MFSRSVSGSLFKEILKFDEEDTMVDQPDMSFPSVSCDEDIELLYESEGSVGSESDDPMRDETLLQDLFYVTKVCCSLSAFRLPFKVFPKQFLRLLCLGWEYFQFGISGVYLSKNRTNYSGVFRTILLFRR